MYRSIDLSVYLSIYQSIDLPVYRSTHVSIYLYSYLSIGLPIYLYVDLSVYLCGCSSQHVFFSRRLFQPMVASFVGGFSRLREIIMATMVIAMRW